MFFSSGSWRAGFISLLIGSDFVVYRNGRTLIFDNLVSDFEHDIGILIRLLFVGASAFARGFGVTRRRDEFRGRNSE
jgi:hypothetical protein